VIVPRKNVSSRLISRVVVEALGNECCIGWSVHIAHSPNYP
jgi:hypothetical protein